MAARPRVVVKLGGSVLTGKGKAPRRGERPLREETLRALARELREASADHEIILVHGGGRYGHPEALRHGLTAFPVASRPAHLVARRRAGVASVQDRMQELAALVQGVLAEEAVDAVPLSGSLLVSASGGRIRGFRMRPVRAVLADGRVPLAYGDAAADRDAGGGIVSGDLIAERLAAGLAAARVVFVTDVEGVSADGPAGRPIARLSPQQARRLIVGPARDATGGMAGKLAAAARIASKGVPVAVVSGLVGGRLAKAIRGQKVQGTVIRP